MTGKHITQDQIAVYRATRQDHTLVHSARIAAISRSSASRIDNGAWDRRKPATRRDRHTKLSGVWDNAGLPYLVEHPKASAKDVHQYLQRICPGLVSPSQRRTIERRCKARKIEHLRNAKDDSVAFFHSAHQGCIDLSSLSERAKTSPDLQTLVRYAKSASLRNRNRAILALAVLNEIPLGRVWRYLKISSSTSNRWAKIFREGGAAKLLFPRDRKPPRSLSKSVNEAVFKVLHSPPSSYGFARTNWRAVDLKAAMKTEGVVTSLWTIRRAIRAAGYRWRKARVVLTSNDPEYRIKIERITSILETLGDDEAFFSVDEYGPFSLKLRKGLRLVGPHDVPSVPQRQKTRGRLIITGALELKTNQVTHFYSDKKSTEEMITLIQLLRKKYTEKKTFFISWDAASWHMSKALSERIDFLNGWANYDRALAIELAPLPSNAQFLNVIEAIFSGMARAVVHNSDFPHPDAAKKLIDTYFAARNAYYEQNPSRAGNKLWGKERTIPVFAETSNHKDPRYR